MGRDGRATYLAGVHVNTMNPPRMGTDSVMQRIYMPDHEQKNLYRTEEDGTYYPQQT